MKILCSLHTIDWDEQAKRVVVYLLEMEKNYFRNSKRALIGSFLKLIHTQNFFNPQYKRVGKNFWDY